METCTNVIHDECAEVLVNTDDSEPRGNFVANQRSKMTSFETLVHTALALEEDPRDEHSYAYSDKKNAIEGMDRDHCYASDSKHRFSNKAQSLSEEDLQTKSDEFCDKNFILPHYRSNDSALDVTGFDTISEKCLSFENINVKTVDVFTESCILPGVSDPDISRMTIQSHKDLEQSVSLPSSPSAAGTFAKDHSYSSVKCQNKHSSEQQTENMLFLRDHSYENKSRRDSVPNNVGVKRGRSNDNISLLGNSNVKRKDFKRSPFLDHTYQSVELQNAHSKKKNYSSGNKHAFKPPHTSEIYKSLKKTSHLMNRGQNGENMASTLCTNQPFLDHTYEEIADSTAGLPFADTSFRSQSGRTTTVVPVFKEHKTELSDHTYEEIADSTAEVPFPDFFRSYSGSPSLKHSSTFKDDNTDQSDHSYVIPSKSSDKCSSSGGESDSGTESLNEDDMSASFKKCVTMYKDHAYVK